MGFYVFDLPSSKDTYEERLKQLLSLQLPLHVNIVNSIQCKSMDQMNSYLESVLEGGEGLMARKPHSIYTPSITPTLLKIKVHQQ